ncbi:XH domain-containing protein [Cephalotus follicularis]|uniref:XH domain-containing protein n=1 Tax=Cephalotus follicularis TaxID=3775 RepID=A0A1Q3BWL3_CEPFO|nr:XH domain-containing protein [Cephalotus follicularis]
MGIEELKGKLQVMKHLEDEYDAAVENKMKEMNNELEQKREDLDRMEDLYHALVVKERESNDELQQAQKELIAGLSEMVGNRTNVGTKRMGEIDQKPFIEMCKQRFLHEEAQMQALTLCSLWQENLKNPEWHPFKIVEIEGTPVEIVNEDDEKLRSLKVEWGNEIYNAVGDK